MALKIHKDMPKEFIAFPSNCKQDAALQYGEVNENQPINYSKVTFLVKGSQRSGGVSVKFYLKTMQASHGWTVKELPIAKPHYGQVT